jgi:hypothetical protein
MCPDSDTLLQLQLVDHLPSIQIFSAYVLLAIAILVVDQICVPTQECSHGTDTIPLVPQSSHW